MRIFHTKFFQITVIDAGETVTRNTKSPMIWEYTRARNTKLPEYHVTMTLDMCSHSVVETGFPTFTNVDVDTSFPNKSYHITFCSV